MKSFFNKKIYSCCYSPSDAVFECTKGIYLSSKSFCTSNSQNNQEQSKEKKYLGSLLTTIKIWCSCHYSARTILSDNRVDKRLRLNGQDQFETILSDSSTNPSPVQSLSDWRPIFIAFLCLIASCCLLTRSVWVVKYGSDALK